MTRFILISFFVVLLTVTAAQTQDSSGVTLVSRAHIQTGSRAIAIDGELACIGTSSRYFETCNFADINNIERLGLCNDAREANDVKIAGDYAFLACFTGGFVVMDISDPENPGFLAGMDTPGRAYHIALNGDYAYLCDYQSLRIIDISDPSRPEEVGTFIPPDFAYDVTIVGEFLYMASGGGLRILDISDPENPEQVSFIETPLLAWRLAVSGDFAYIAEIESNDGNVHGNLRIIDIANPEDPVEVGVFGEIPERIWSVTVTNNHAYLANYEYLRVLDVSDAENPTEIGWYELQGSARDLAVDEPFVHVAEYTDYVIYDCSNAIGQPDIQIAEEDLAHDFGDVVVGLAEPWDFMVLNEGHFELTINELDIDNNAFSLRNSLSQWKWQDGFAVPVRDNRVNGVEYVDGTFFVTGGNNGEMVNQVYMLNREGEQIGSFEQFAESPWGMRDLAYDGELLWGADGQTVYGFTTEGELVAEFEGPIETIRSLAYDQARELIWLCDLTSSLYGVDREGNIVIELENPGARIYGMAYHPEDPDDYNLYLLTWSQEHPVSLSKVDIENGEMELIREELGAQIGERSGGGLTITDAWDPPGWDVIAMVDGARDAVEVWQVTDFYRGGEFILPAEDQTRVTVVFTPEEAGEYEGILTLDCNDPDEPEIEIELRGAGGENRAPEWIDMLEVVEADEGELIEFEVAGIDADETPLTIRLDHAQLPYRARLEDRGDGTATLSWQSNGRDAGEYVALLALSDGIAKVEAEVRIVINHAERVVDVPETPLTLQLYALHPNPFNSYTTIRYDLPQASSVTLKVYNVAGQLIETLFDGNQGAGTHAAILNAGDLSSGVYLVRFEGSGRVLSRKVVLTR